MLEAWKIPILTTALNLLFDIWSFILDDIKSRRKARLQEKEEISNENNAASDKSITTIVSTKEQALKLNVDEITFSKNEKDINHLVNLLQIYTTNYQIAEKKYAMWGSSLAPQIIIHDLEEAENNYIQTVIKLKKLIEETVDTAITIDGSTTE